MFSPILRTVRQFVATLFVVTPAAVFRLLVNHEVLQCLKAPLLNGDSTGGKILAIYRKRS